MKSEFVNIISNVGFPIFLTVYLLTRIEGKLDTLSGSINDLTKTLSRMERWKYGFTQKNKPQGKGLFFVLINLNWDNLI